MNDATSTPVEPFERPAQAPESAGPAEPAGPYRGPDRRQRPTPRLSRFSFLGGRRRQAGVGEFVDQYGRRLWLMLAWVGLMNVADSFFTLWHLQEGAIELNPFAAMLLRTGRIGFVLSKALLITVPLVVLCIHKNFQLARMGLWLAATAYTVLIAYHLWLL